MPCQIETHQTQQDYCQTPAYRKWVSNWKPKDNTIDVWADTEDAIYWNPEGDSTPRERIYQRRSTRLPYHFLEELGIDDKKPTVDIGCGYNMFSRVYPFIWGVDPNHPSAHEKLDQNWWTQNLEQWNTAFAINSMHFVSQSQIPNQLEKMVSILQPYGKAFVALNRGRIKAHTGNDYNALKLQEDIHHMSNVTRIIWIEKPEEEGLDGNVWIWLKK